jgi:hypothetical protein
MRISDMLNAIASWLESPDNEALLLSEYDKDSMEITAKACVEAAAILRKGAEQVELSEPEQDSSLTEDSIEEIATLASVFDQSDDANLKRTASVLDEILLTIGTNSSALNKSKMAAENRIEDLKKKYEELKNDSESEKIADAQKAIANSPYTKEYRSMEHALSTRYCPDHPGAPISRVGESLYQCSLDKKQYDFRNGYEDLKGNKVPGGDVSDQGYVDSSSAHSIFDTREGRLNR